MLCPYHTKMTGLYVLYSIGDLLAKSQQFLPEERMFLTQMAQAFPTVGAMRIQKIGSEFVRQMYRKLRGT